MGEKGNVADVRHRGGHVPVTSQPPPAPPSAGGGAAGGGGGGLLDELADRAADKATDIGLGGEGLGIVNRERDDDET